MIFEWICKGILCYYTKQHNTPFFVTVVYKLAKD